MIKPLSPQMITLIKPQIDQSDGPLEKVNKALSEPWSDQNRSLGRLVSAPKETDQIIAVIETYEAIGWSVDYVESKKSFLFRPIPRRKTRAQEEWEAAVRRAKAKRTHKGRCPMVPHIQATTDHPFNDPWAEKHRMKSRVGQGPYPGYYVFVWSLDGVGWVYGGSDESVQKLLDLEPQASTI